MTTDKMKRRAVAGGVMAALAAVLLAVTLVINLTDPASVSASPEDQDSYLYTILDYEGKVTVLKRGEETPCEIFDTYTSSLPEPDQQELKKGVRIYSDRQLQKAIEDYTS